MEELAQRRALGGMGRTTAPDAGLVLHPPRWHASLSHSVTFCTTVNRLSTVHEMHATRRLKRAPRTMEEPAQRWQLGYMGRTTAPDAGLVLHPPRWHASPSHSCHVLHHSQPALDGA